MSKIFNRQNLILLLLITLIAHNYYLQRQVEEAVDYAGWAASKADDAADYAKSASMRAEEASEYAYDAYENTFGRQCGWCP